MDAEAKIREAREAEEQKDFGRAAEKYTLVLNMELFPEQRVQSYCGRATCHFANRDYKQAKKDLAEALRLDPDNLQAHMQLAECATKLDDLEGAFTSYQKGLKLSPNNADIISKLKNMQDILMTDHMKRSQNVRDLNVLSFCSQDPYPGDLQQLQLERMMMKEKIEKAPELNLRDQDPDEAAKQYHLAVRYKKAGRFQDALNYCQEALDLDAGNNTYWRLQSELNFQLGNYADAFNEISLIARDMRTVDDWKLGGKILAKLEYNVNAELLFKKATKLSNGKDREAMSGFQKVRCDRLYKPLTKDLSVEVRFGEYGRGLFACDDIPEGAYIFEDLPLIACQTLDTMEAPSCAQCAKSLLSPVHYFGPAITQMTKGEYQQVKTHWPEVTITACEKCNREEYCSEDCRDLAWYEHHQILCPSVNPYTHKLYDFCDKGVDVAGKFWESQCSPMVLARIWASCVAEAHRQAEAAGVKTPTVEHWAYAKCPIRRFIAIGTADYCSYVPEMYQLMKNIFKKCPNGVTYPIDEAEFNGRFYQAGCNVQAFSDSSSPFKRFKENLQQSGLSGDGMSILRFFSGEPKEATFAGMFPLHATMNHSCDHNVICYDTRVEDKPGIVIKSRRLIKKGEELFHTYVDATESRKSRRANLLRSFNFLCECPRCKFEGDEPHVCTNCGKEAAYGKNFSTCGRCRRAWYCSPECQKIAWKAGHKRTCKTYVKKEKDKYEVPTAKLFYC